MIESLTKAQHDAQFCADNLSAALKVATATEALVILPLITTCMKTLQAISALLQAVQE